MANQYRTFAALPPNWSASILTKSPSQFRVLLSDEPLLQPDQVIKNLLDDGLSSLDDFSAKYKLDELYKMQDCKLESNTPEKTAMEYVRHCLKDVDDVNPEGFKFNQIVPSWERLAPFISTSIQRPDVSITNTSGDCILTAEVHSGSGKDSLESTAYKEVIGLVTQLRDLRTKSDIQSLVGFVFPNLTCHSSVVMVTVDFVPFRFQYSFKRLQKDEVCVAVKEAFKRNHHSIMEARYAGDLKRAFPIRLSEDELASIELELASKQLESQARRPKPVPKSLEQISSVASIILKDPKEGKIYKYNHDPMQYVWAKCVMSEIAHVKERNPGCLEQLLTYEEERTIFGINFYVFPLITPPLSYTSAQRCLGPLIESTAEAIESLHKLGFAHLDIRLDNICFRSGAVLIDFDFARKATDTSVREYTVDGNTVSCMYKRGKKSKTAAQYDWMQLGWMGFWIHNLEYACVRTSYHTMDSLWGELPTCNFLKGAVDNGVYSKDSLLSSPVYTKHNESLDAVLRTREDA